MFNFTSNIETCYSEIPNLLYYSHIPAVIVSLLLGIFIFVSNKSLLSKILLTISLLFSLWAGLSLVSWISVSGLIISYIWTFFGIISALLFLSCIYFTEVYITKKDVNIKTKIIWLLMLLPLIIFLKRASSEFNIVTCEATEDNYYTIYYYIIGLISFLWILFFAISSYFKTEDKTSKKQITILTTGISAFLISFFITGFWASYVDNFDLEQYGLFGMIIFTTYLAFLIVRFKAFDIKLLGAQALVWALVILVGSQFLFIQSNVNKVLTGITLIISAFVGIMIVRSVKKEVALREQLEIANNNQQALIHFISHQIKGFFTKSKMIFSGLIEGDFGEVNPTVIEMANTGLASDNNAVAMVQDILGASNLKTGTTDYNFKLVDLTMIVNRVAQNFKPEMEKKGLKLELDISTIPMPAMVDETQITQVFKNLMDNSLRYTPTGEIKVSLQPNPEDKKKGLFVIKDTGVGLSDGDKAKLFTEGGKGEESLKVNTNSTGYGLYIVRKIVESHKGRIWAESAGRGHGSQFCVELPITA